MNIIQLSDKRTIRKHGENWVRNATANRDLYLKDKDSGRPFLAGGEYGRNKGEPICLIGPGPSLDLVAPMMAAPYKENMVTVACNSALNPLAGHRIIPGAVYALDASALPADHVEEYVAFVGADRLKNTPLIIANTVDPRIPAAWPGPRLWFTMHEYGHESMGMLTDVLKIQFPDCTPIPNAGCVFLSMLIWAINSGFSPILIAGFELPVKVGSAYSATRYRLLDDDRKPLKPPRPILDKMRHVDFGTVYQHRGYIHTLLRVASETSAHIINLSPFASFDGLVGHTAPPDAFMSGKIPPLDEAEGRALEAAAKMGQEKQINGCII